MLTSLEQISELNMFITRIRLERPHTPEGFKRIHPLPRYLSYTASNLSSIDGRQGFEEFEALCKADYYLRRLGLLSGGNFSDDYTGKQYVELPTGESLSRDHAKSWFKRTYTTHMNALANPSRKDAQGRSALHLAIEHGRPLFLDELLSHGADIKDPYPVLDASTTMSVLKATQFFAEKMDDGKPETKKRYEDVKKVLLAHGAKPEESANKSEYEYSFHSKQKKTQTRLRQRDEILHQVIKCKPDKNQ